MKRTTIYAMLAILLAMVSCEKFSQEETDTDGAKAGDAKGNIELHLDSCQQQRITISIFQDDKKVKNIHTLVDDLPNNLVKISLPEGSYQMVVIAHNGEANCTISSPQKITFANNKVTDTSYLYDTLKVGANGINKSLCLKRAVATFRLNLTDSLSEEMYQLKFYYTGGSSTFNAYTGYGCVNSRQTEYRTINPQVSDYYVYTFPHKEKKMLNMVISVQDNKQNDIKEETLEDVPIVTNDTTLYRGNFETSFSNETSSNTDINFSFDDTWKENDDVPFFHKSR